MDTKMCSSVVHIGMENGLNGEISTRFTVLLFYV